MLNKIQIIGRMGKDPEVRYMSNGDAVCNFSVATSERWKDKTTGETKEETTWHRVSAWGRQAEIVGEYLRKGALVYVEGKQICRKYTDKDGQERESWEIRMQEMKMMPDQKRDAQTAPRSAPTPAQNAPRKEPVAAGSGFDDMDSDIPF
jgi:single-strand DNA-binding protein